MLVFNKKLGSLTVTKDLPTEFLQKKVEPNPQLSNLNIELSNSSDEALNQYGKRRSLQLSNNFRCLKHQIICIIITYTNIKGKLLKLLKVQAFT